MVDPGNHFEEHVPYYCCGDLAGAVELLAQAAGGNYFLPFRAVMAGYKPEDIAEAGGI